MGKRIKSTGIILDASSTGSAPVSPTGTVALRAKSDSTQFQYSANGGAWTDFGGGGAGGTLTGKWLWSNVTTGAVATGVIAINNADPSAATEIRIHETTNESVAFAGSFDLVIPGSHIYVQDADDATRWVRYNVTAPATDHGDYRHWPVSLVSYGGVNLNNGEVVNLQFLSSGSGAIPRLDEVLDPTTNASFEMGNHQLVFHFTGAEAEENVVFESLAPGTTPASGPIMLIRASGSATEKSPLRIEGRGAFYFSVGVDGKVAIGTESGLANKLTVYHMNTGGSELGAIQGNVFLASGNTASSISSAVFGVSDDGNTTALTEMRALSLQLGRSGPAVSNTGLTAYIIDARATISANTGTCYGLYLRPTVTSAMTLTTWEGIHVTAPNLLSGGAITNTRAIVTEAGAGYVGLGTSTPTVQLHVVGAMHDEQTTGQVFTIAKTHNSETPQLDFKRTQATGLYLNDDDVAGRIMFYGWFSPGPFKALGYIQSTFDTNFGNAGKIAMGAGDFNNARVEVLQTDTATGGVTIYGAATTPWFAVTSVGHLFSHGTTGSIYYRDAAGYFVNLDIFSHPTDPDDEGKVLTVYSVGGVLLPQWRAGGVSGGTPADPVNTLQYNAAGNFGAVASSVVSGANVTLGGIFTVASGGQTLAIDPTATDLILTFSDVVGSPTQMGYIKSYWDGTYSGGRLDLGAGAVNDSARITMLETASSAAITLHATPFLFQVQTAGYQLYGGALGTLWYSQGTGPSGNGWLVPTAVPPTYTATPTPETSDRIAFWDSSAGTVSWLTAGTGLAISGTTLSALGGAALAGGSNLQVQYNNATALGGITGFEVSSTGGAPNMVLGGGYFQIAAGLTASVPNIDQEFFISATTAAATRFVMRRYSSTAIAGTYTDGPYIEFDRGRGSVTSKVNLSNDDTIGQIRFSRWVDSALVQSAYIRSWYDGTYGGGRLDLGAGAYDDFARITMLDTGSSAAITLYGNSTFYFQVQTAGYVLNGGGLGTLWYSQGSGASGYLVPTAVPPAADRIAFWDASTSQVSWLTAGSGLTITGTTMTASGSAAAGGSNFQLQYNNSGAFGGITNSANTQHFLKSSGTGAAPAFTNIAAADILSGTLPLARGGTGSGMIDPNADRIMFWDDSAGAVDWLTAGTGLTITGTTITAAGGPTLPSGSLQYNNGGVFGAVTSSSVDGSGVITIGSTGMIFQNDTAVLLSYRHGSSTAASAPTFTFERARGTWSSKSAVLAGDYLHTQNFFGYYDASASRQGGQILWTATGNYSTSSAPTVFRLKTTHLNQNFPLERLLIGGSKSLLVGGVDNTLVDLFTITFNAADQVGLGGEIHMLFIAKQVAGTVHTQVYRRVVSFIIGHNGATNTSMANFREEAGGQASAASNTTGFGGLSHAINADAAVSIGTNIPASPNLIATNTITYRILADSDLTTISQLTCYYHIIYHGEGELTLS